METSEVEEPNLKRIRISIEPHVEKKIFSMTEDGRENILVESPSSEKFSKLVRQTDVQKLIREKLESLNSNEEVQKEDESKKDDSKKKESVVPASSQWLWQNVAENLFHARVECEHLLGLIDMLQGSHQLSVWNIVKPAASLASYNSDLALRQFSKQKELLSAATILSRGAQTLKDIVQREKVYYDELIQIRSRWLLIARSAKTPTGVKRDYGKFWVDYSYTSAGSNIARFSPLIPNSNGKVSAEERDLSFKSIHMSNQNQEHGQIGSYSLSNDIFSQLTQLQHSTFYYELFECLIDEATDKANESSSHGSVQVPTDNELKIENNSSNYITISLKSTKKSVSTPVPDWSQASSLIFAVYGVVLQQLLRQHHARSFANKGSINLNVPSSVIAKDTKIRTSSGILNSFVAFYYHSCYFQQLQKVLHDIFLTIPNVHVHWCFNGKPNTVEVEIQYGTRLTLDFIIAETYVQLGHGTDRGSHFTIEELSKFILMQLAKFMVEELFIDVSTSGIETRKDQLSLRIFLLKKSITISLYVARSTIDLKVIESSKERRDIKIINMDSIPGDNIYEKAKYIISNAKLYNKKIKSIMLSASFRKQKSLSPLLSQSIPLNSNQSPMDLPLIPNLSVSPIEQSKNDGSMKDELLLDQMNGESEDKEFADRMLSSVNSFDMDVKMEDLQSPEIKVSPNSTDSMSPAAKQPTIFMEPSISIAEQNQPFASDFGSKEIASTLAPTASGEIHFMKPDLSSDQHLTTTSPPPEIEIIDDDDNGDAEIETDNKNKRGTKKTAAKKPSTSRRTTRKKG